MGRKWMNLFGITLVAVFAACGGSDTDVVPTTTQNQELQTGVHGPGDMMDLMKNVTLTLTDVEGGIAVDFVTSDPGQVDRVRLMVKHMAAMHSNDGGTPGGHGGHHGGGGSSGSGSCSMGGGHQGMGGGMMGGHGGMGGGCCSGGNHPFAGAALTAGDVEGGARLTFTATTPEAVESLREKVRSHFSDLTTGRCPMM